MDNPIIYVVLNKELHMSPGKAAAQAVHAAMMLQDNFGGSFTSAYKRTVIILEAENTNQIRNLHEYLRNAEIFSAYYIDEGNNEVAAYSLTALAVEPFECDDEDLREIFSQFKLFDVEPPVIVEKHYDTNAHAEALGHLAEIPQKPWYVRRTMKWLGKQK